MEDRLQKGLSVGVQGEGPVFGSGSQDSSAEQGAPACECLLREQRARDDKPGNMSQQWAPGGFVGFLVSGQRF